MISPRNFITKHCNLNHNEPPRTSPYPHPERLPSRRRARRAGGGDEIIPISNALDALECGFKVNVHLAACRGVDLQAADCDMAVAAMREHGAVIR